MVEKHAQGPNLNFYTRDGNLANGDIFGMQLFGNVIMAYPDKSPTPRAVKYLAMAATGMCIREISDAVYLSPNTIKSHLTKAYKQLDARNVSQATRLLFETQVFAPDEIKVSPDIRFSGREVEVLDVMSYGNTMDEAGRVLNITGNTIRNHLRRMANRNNMPHVGNAGLVMTAFCRGELTPDTAVTVPELDPSSFVLSQAS